MERDELHSKLEMKLIDCWNAYVDGLLTLQPIDIIGKAAEIAAARFCYDELTEITAAYPDLFLEHLLGFDDPLGIMQEQWLEEQCVDLSAELEHALWSLWDHGPHPGDLSMDGMNQ